MPLWQVLFQTACGLSILAAGPGEAAGNCLDRAFEVLTRLVDGGRQDRAALETDLDLGAVPKDRRFAELLKRLEAQKPDPGLNTSPQRQQGLRRLPLLALRACVVLRA